MNQARQSLGQHMGVDLSRCDVGMAQHGLHGAQIGAVVEQMRGEGMPHHMRAEPRRRDTCRDGQFLQHLPEALPGEMTLPRGWRREDERGGCIRALRPEEMRPVG